METKTKTKAAGEASASAAGKMDKLRKGCIASCCQWLETLDPTGFCARRPEERTAYAKGLICRAAGVESTRFNRIGEQRLRGLTAMFNKRRRDMEGVMREAYNELGIKS